MSWLSAPSVVIVVVVVALCCIGIGFDCRPGSATTNTCCCSQWRRHPSCLPTHPASPVNAVGSVLPIAPHVLAWQSTATILGQLGTIHCGCHQQRQQMNFHCCPSPPPPHMPLSLILEQPSRGRQLCQSCREHH